MVESNAEQLLKRLSRGLLQTSYKEIFVCHRLLVDIGEPVIPLIRNQLLGQPWNEIKHSAQLNILSGLLSVVNDIMKMKQEFLVAKLKSVDVMLQYRPVLKLF